MAVAILHAGLGDADAAFEWLETAYRFRNELYWLFTKFPGLDPIRPDPRFAALVHRIRVLP